MMKIDQLKNARQVAVYALDRVLSSGAYSNISLNQVLSETSLSNEDRGLATNIFYGVLQHKLTLEYWLEPFVKDKKLDSWVRTLLLTAIFQMQYLDRVPTFAIVNESIQVAKDFGHTGIRKLVTAILHRITETELTDFSQIDDETKRLSLQNSVPTWLIQELMAQYGHEQTINIIESINQPANHSIRLNTKLTNTEKVTTELSNLGLEVTDSKVAANALVTNHPIMETKLFQNGEITVQDESAMLAVQNMSFDSADTVLDACGAPGGKTTQIAEQLDHDRGGEVYSLDIHKNKIRLIEKNAERMRVQDEVNAILLDARKVSARFADLTFDSILVDAPCTGIGLMRRKPEIRYDKQLSDSLNLQQIQLAILNAVAPKLKKDGIMTYSTCTILKQENEQVVEKFLAANPDFELQRTNTALDLKADRQTETITILPSDYGSDGFFVASLKKKM